MSMVRAVSLDRLRLYLRDVLGGESLIYHRFDVALRNHDVDLIARAMDSLALCPAEIRSRVEDVLLQWIFDPTETVTLAEAAAPIETKQ